LGLACEWRGSTEAGTVAVVTGALPALDTRVALLAGLLWPSAATYTPAATTAEIATSAVVAVIRPVRKLISSSRALTAERRPDRVCDPWYPPTFTTQDDTDKGGQLGHFCAHLSSEWRKLK
jgi:hypothetical protein